MGVRMFGRSPLISGGICDNGLERKAVRRGWNPTPDLAATSRKGDALASVQATALDPTSVYRYYDSIGILIYVGITRQGMGRNTQHNGKAEWWPFVARQEVDHFPTRGAAAMREKELIRSHRPPFNKQHNHAHGQMREAYLAYAAEFSMQMESPFDIYQALGKRLPLDILIDEPGCLVLRSRLAHGPLATLLTKGGGVEEPAVRSARRRYGHVEKVEVVGPTVSIRCRMRSGKKAKLPEGGLIGASVLMAWDTKGKRPTIRQLVVVEGEPLPGPRRLVAKQYGPDTLLLPAVS